jgi:hypothetical protein
LHCIAGWSAFRNYDILCKVTSIGGVLALFAAFVALVTYRGDWRFRVPALLLIFGYVSLLAFGLWRFYTSAD